MQMTALFLLKELIRSVHWSCTFLSSCIDSCSMYQFLQYNVLIWTYDELICRLFGRFYRSARFLEQSNVWLIVLLDWQLLHFFYLLERFNIFYPLLVSKVPNVSESVMTALSMWRKIQHNNITQTADDLITNTDILVESIAQVTNLS